MTPRMGFNVQAEEVNLVDGITPIVAIPHVDFQGWQTPYIGKNVALWRLDLAPNNDKHRDLPHGAAVQLWNEDDDIRAGLDPAWRAAKVAQVRAERADLVIVYGAPRVDGDLYGFDFDLAKKCDIIGMHVTTFADFANDFNWFGARWMVTEIEADPNHPETYPDLYACAVRALDYQPPTGPMCEGAFLWGSSLTGADAVENLNGIDFRGQVAQYNNTHPTPVINTVPTPGSTKPAAQLQAEQAYNLLTGGKPFVTGKQYVQANADQSYTVVVTYS